MSKRTGRPSWSDAELASLEALFERWSHNGPPLTLEQQRERQSRRSQAVTPPIDDAPLETIAAVS